jgi:hypothetical protein
LHNVIQQNDTRQNDIQHINKNYDAQLNDTLHNVILPNDTQHNYRRDNNKSMTLSITTHDITIQTGHSACIASVASVIMLSDAFFIVMLSIFKRNVVILNVVAPFDL